MPFWLSADEAVDDLLCRLGYPRRSATAHPTRNDPRRHARIDGALRRPEAMPYAPRMKTTLQLMYDEANNKAGTGTEAADALRALIAEMLQVKPVPWKRVWAMPNKDTLTIGPIRELVERYIADATLTADPFARNCTLADITNDRDLDTAATFHMDVDAFLEHMAVDPDTRTHALRPDLFIFDPPYTYNQLCESYGQKLTQAEAQRFGIWPRAKDLMAKMQKPGGRVIHMGHHTMGMCKKRGYRIIEGLIVGHGRAHNDTLIIVEEKE